MARPAAVINGVVAVPLMVAIMIMAMQKRAMAIAVVAMFATW